jgi:tripartite ATP-independent transporter DctM subunit
MRRYGYQRGFATATLAVVGTLAIMIPPSLGLVLYGLFTETSVGRLLVAGLLPGVVTGLGYVLTIHVMVRRKPDIAPTAPEPASAAARLSAARAVWPVLLLLGAMVFALYSGIITPTEVGAVGALMALLVAVAAGRCGFRELAAATMRGARVSAMVMTIVAFAAVFGVFLTMTGVTSDLIEAIRSAGVNRWLVLVMVLLLLLVLGFFLDQLAILLLTLPLTFPLLTELGFDPIWMGVVFVKTAEIGLVTPPMGMNVFVVSGVTRVPVAEIYRGVWPFVATELGVLTLLVALPGLSTFLPGVIFG